MEDFIPKYTSPVYTYKEFIDISNNQSRFKHQDFLTHYYGSIYSENEILLFHEMGTGKTRTSIAIVERLLAEYPWEYKGALILTRGRGLIQNYINELVNNSDKYTPNSLNVQQHPIKLRKKIEEKYTFYTFEVFAKLITDMTNQTILQRFDSMIIVIDEVHNIRDIDTKSTIRVYDSIYRFLHILKHRKIILLTGTPMKDGPEEIASLMNLILEKENQMPTNINFLTTFFNEKDELINKLKLKEFFNKKISFLQNTISDVKKEYVGVILPPLKHFKVIPLEMEDHQNDAYESAWKMDQNAVNIYSNIRQASLCVDENKNFGHNISMKKFNRSMSCKYDELIQNLKQHSNELTIVYADIVKGSGLQCLSKCLQLNGFNKGYGKPKSFIILTSKITEHQKQHYISIFNNKDNVFGEKLFLILGSRVIMEGYTFKNVLHEHVLTPHWNYSETSQFISRGWRANSHRDLIEKQKELSVTKQPTLFIYQYVCIPKRLPSIDMMMYATAEKKDLMINQVIRVIKECAFDCAILKNLNVIKDYDNMRECHYTLCSFNCDSSLQKTDEVNYNTYDLFFFKNSPDWNAGIQTLRILFKKQWFIKWNILQTYFRDFQIAQLLLYCKKEYIAFENPRGYYSHLCYNDKGVFCVPLYYQGESISQALHLCKYQKNIPMDIDQINLKYILNNINIYLDKLLNVQDYETCVKILKLFPIFIQEIILKNVLKLKIFPNIKYSKLLNFSLKYYETSIFETDEYIGFFLQDDKFFCISKVNGFEAEETIAKKYFEEQKQRIENNSLGYHGQENRNLNEFCIKQTTNLDEKNKKNIDKRKILSGRRCVNWNKKDLIKVANKVLTLDPGIKFDTVNRYDLCSQLKNFFRDNNLLINDNTCGTQYKLK
jgi:hypothetical protein